VEAWAFEKSESLSKAEAIPSEDTNPIDEEPLKK
jgi:hypothetical protein